MNENINSFQPLEPLNICPECGSEFYCSKSAKCWCFEINVLPEKQDEIRKKYDTCLCPDCLNRYSADPA